MSRKFLSPINLRSLPSDPSSGTDGDIYYNSTSNLVRIYKNGSWSNLTSSGGGGGLTAVVDDTAPQLGGNLDANGYNITNTQYVGLDTTPSSVPTSQGSLYWDSGDSVVKSVLNSNVEIGIGQEEVVLVKNNTGSTISKGKVVYINGAQGQRPTIALSHADTEATSSKTLGLTAESIANGAEGFVTIFGVLRGVNTSGYTEGIALWLSPSAGQYTSTKPSAPNHLVFIGYVVKAHATAGEIFVKPQNGYELEELHNVSINDSLTNDQALVYESSSSLWKPKNIVNSISGTTNEINVSSSTGSVQIGLPDDVTIGNDLTVTGNLTVNGTTTTLNTANLLVEDNVIVLNSNITGSPSLNAGIEVERGTSDNVSIIWDESIDRWRLTGDGTNYYSIAVQNGWTVSGSISITSSDGSSEGNISFNSYGNQISLSDSNGFLVKTGASTKIFAFNNDGSITFPNSTTQSTAFLGISSYDTDDISEGTTNKYFTNSRAVNALTSTLSDYLTISSAASIYQPIGSYLTSETDPVFTASAAYGITSTEVTHWNTAYGWGNHSTAGYLTSFTETDPIFASSAAYGIISTDISHWNSAYGWGDHSTAGYALSSHNHTVNSLSNVVITSISNGQALAWDSATSKWINQTISSLPSQTGNSGKYLTTDGSSASWSTIDLSAYLTTSNASSTYQPLDADLTAIAGISSNGILKRTGSNTWSVLTDNSSNWNTAYGWGNHALAGYLTSYTETDPIFIASVAYGITSTQVTHWNTAYGWGNHASAGYLTSYTETQTLQDVTALGATTSSAISITNSTESTSISTGALKVSGGLGVIKNAYIGGDLDIAGNFTVHGTTTTINTTNLAIDDSLIYLAENQYDTDTMDIGIYGAYGDSNPGHFHTGLVRKSGGGWHLFSNGTEPTSNTISLTGVNYDTLKIGSLQVTDASTTRSNLGLGTMAVETATNYLTTSTASTTYAPIASPTFTGTVTSPILRLTGTTDVSPSSTAHAFQIGDSASTNIRIDINEILAVNNGVNSNLNLQTDGGLVLLGNNVLDGTALGLEVHGPLRFESSLDSTNNSGQASMRAKVGLNSTANRQEFQIYAAGDAYSTGSKGSGIHLYGNDDRQHASNISFLTGPPDQGDARMIIAGGTGTTGYINGVTTYTRTNTDTRITIGNSLWDWVDTKQDTGLLNLKDASSRPSIFVTSANSTDGTTYGTIAMATGSAIGIGHWSGTTYTNRLSISSAGAVSIPGSLSVTGHPTLEGVTSTGATGTGKLVFDGSPTLTTPTLGVASATSINKVAITAPTTSATLTILDGKTLTANNSITLAGTDSTTMTFPSTSATIARTDAGQTFTGVNTFTSPTINTSITTSSTTFNLVNVTPTTVNFAGNATTISIGASTGTTTVNNNLSALVGSFTGGTTIDSRLKTTTYTGTTTVTDSGSAITASAANPRVVEYTIFVSNGTNSYASKVLLLANGSTPTYTEYGILQTSSTFGATISVTGTTSVYITVTPTVGGTPQSRMSRTVLEI